MSDKPTGVFVRLPLNEEQKQGMYDYVSGDASMEDAIRGIGTPVIGGDIPIIGTIHIGENEKPFFTAPELYSVGGDVVRQSDAQAQIAALEAEVVRLRSAVTKTSAALERVTEERMTSYQAKNGRWVSIQGHDGERCDIIHSDITTDCEAAILTAQESLKGGAA